MNDIVSLIGSVGFPIVACGYMATKGFEILRQLSDNLARNTAAVEKMSLLLTKSDLTEDDL